MSVQFTEDERVRVMTSILSWKTEEEEVGAGETFNPSAFNEYLDMLASKDDEALQSHWNETVGRWVLSRGDITIPDGIEYEAWLAGQFEAVKNGSPTEWGFVVQVPEHRVRDKLNKM